MNESKDWKRKSGFGITNLHTVSSRMSVDRIIAKGDSQDFVFQSEIENEKVSSPNTSYSSDTLEPADELQVNTDVEYIEDLQQRRIGPDRPNSKYSILRLKSVVRRKTGSLNEISPGNRRMAESHAYISMFDEIMEKIQPKADKKPRAIQIIRFDPESEKFEINPELAEVLANYEGNIGFVSLAGKRKSGKSFLLNNLLNLKGNGFKIDNVETKNIEGIWMWSSPKYIEKQNLHLFFINCIGNDDSREQADCKIFAIALLMSSFFIFNSLGKIPTEQIKFLKNFTNFLQKCSKFNSVPGKSSIFKGKSAVFTPSSDSSHEIWESPTKILWLLRDVKMSDDSNSNEDFTIFRSQYFADELIKDLSCKPDEFEKLRYTKNFKSFIRNAEVITVDQPFENEGEDGFTYYSRGYLSESFERDIQFLKEKIFFGCKPKAVAGINLNSRMFCNYLQILLQTLNKNGLPNMSLAYEYMVEYECYSHYSSSKRLYKNAMERLLFTEKIITSDELIVSFKKLRDVSTEYYNENLNGLRTDNKFKLYRSQLLSFIDDEEKKAFEIASALSISYCEDVLKKASTKITEGLKGIEFNEVNFSTLISDLKNFLDDYHTYSKGKGSSIVLVNFLIDFNMKVITSIVNSLEKAYQIIKAQGTRAYDDTVENSPSSSINALQDRLNQFENRDRKITQDLKTVEKMKQEEAKVVEDEKAIKMRLEHSIREAEKTLLHKQNSINVLRAEVDKYKKKKIKLAMFYFKGLKKNKFI